MCGRGSLEVWVENTIPEDFINIDIDLSNYAPTSEIFDIEHGKKVINYAENLLTFHSKYGILGIVGVCQGEVFSYISQAFKHVVTKSDLIKLRKLVKILVGNGPAYMAVYNERAKRFASFLGFKSTGEYMGESEIYEW